MLFYLNPVTSAWQSTPPTFSRGLQGGVRFRVTNNTGYLAYVRVESDRKKPDGTTTRYIGATASINAGVTRDWDMTFTADQAGTWQHTVAVYAGLTTGDMTLVASQGLTTAAIVTAAAAGAITGNWFQNPATGIWQETAPSYLVGQMLYLRGYAQNLSWASKRARMDAHVTNPAGAVSTITGIVATQAAGEIGYWEFSTPLNLQGTWSITLILYGELV
ncbi:MAG: hypothetical protein Q8O76_03745 [Chloroflexota bacterium]|nr:hypothetical protein [Chloroflexota bacterium]